MQQTISPIIRPLITFAKSYQRSLPVHLMNTRKVRKTQKLKKLVMTKTVMKFARVGTSGRQMSRNCLMRTIPF